MLKKKRIGLTNMYGLVNKAVEGLVVSNFGEETWEQIKGRASVDIDMFISNDSYPDSITYDLLVAEPRKF